MLKIEVIEHLQRIIKNEDELGNRINSWFLNGARIIQGEYKKQMPVNKGTARKDVQIVKEGDLNFIITTPTTEKGFAYPIAIHEGTGKFKGSSYDFNADNSSRGFTRENSYTDEEIILFKVLAKRGVKMSIPPNKFADRARHRAEVMVNGFIENELVKFSKEK